MIKQYLNCYFRRQLKRKQSKMVSANWVKRLRRDKRQAAVYQYQTGVYQKSRAESILEKTDQGRWA